MLYHAIPGSCNNESHLRKSSINTSSINFNPTVGGDSKQLEWVLIKLMHASGNACVSRHSNALGNTCVYQCSTHTLTADRLKKEVRFAVDMAVCAPPGKPQQAPIKIVDGRPWSPGVYQLLCLLGKTLEVAWVRGFI